MLVEAALSKAFPAPDGTWYHLFRKFQPSFETHHWHHSRIVFRGCPSCQWRLSKELFEINCPSWAPLYFWCWYLCTLQIFCCIALKWSIWRMRQLSNRVFAMQSVGVSALRHTAECLEIKSQSSEPSLTQRRGSALRYWTPSLQGLKRHPSGRPHYLVTLLALTSASQNYFSLSHRDFHLYVGNAISYANTSTQVDWD